MTTKRSNTLKETCSWEVCLYPKKTSENFHQKDYYSENSLLREKGPNTEFFLVGIFPHPDWIRSIFRYSVRMRENMDQKKLRIWTLFTQWLIQKKLESPLNSTCFMDAPKTNGQPCRSKSITTVHRDEETLHSSFSSGKMKRLSTYLKKRNEYYDVQICRTWFINDLL